MTDAEKYSTKHNIHHVLTHVYITFFVLFLIGVSLDLAFQVTIPHFYFMQPLGVFLLLVSTFLIFWAQKTGRDLRNIKEIKTEHFCRGPYCYTRIPTQWGLLMLILGFGLVINAFFVVLTTLISFLFSKIVFMDRHDQILIEKFGASYLDYKNMFKF